MWIIDLDLERQREIERQRDEEARRIYLPLPEAPPPRAERIPPKPEPKRVIEIQL